MVTKEVLLIQASAIFIIGMCVGANNADIPQNTKMLYASLNDALPRNDYIEYLLIPFFFVAIVTAFIGEYFGYGLAYILGTRVWEVIQIISYFPMLLAGFYLIKIIRGILK